MGPEKKSPKYHFFSLEKILKHETTIFVPSVQMFLFQDMKTTLVVGNVDLENAGQKVFSRQNYSITAGADLLHSS